MSIKDIESQLKKIQIKLDSEDAIHNDIADQVRAAGDKQMEILSKVLRHEKHIDSHTGHLKELCAATKRIDDRFEAFATLEGLANNIDTIAKFGRLVRAIILWTSAVAGGIALIWASFQFGVKGQ